MPRFSFMPQEQKFFELFEESARNVVQAAQKLKELVDNWDNIEAMVNEILSGEYDRIVLDSITPLSEMPIYLNSNRSKSKFDNSLINSEEFHINPNLPVRRLHLHYIMNSLESSESTSVITSELSMGSSLFSRDGITEFLADGVITLSFDPTMDRRKLSVMKMRNTNHTLKPQDIEISVGGIRLI